MKYPTFGFHEDFKVFIIKFLHFEICAGYKPGGFRNCFFCACFFFNSARFNLDAAVGCVFLLFFGTVRAVSRSPMSFLSAPSLFFHWVRAEPEVTSNSPAELILFFNFIRISCFSFSLNISDDITGNRSSILVFTLLTFCPPGPPLRLAEICVSSSIFSIWESESAIAVNSFC
jgi:hypothetical protein